MLVPAVDLDKKTLRQQNGIKKQQENDKKQRDQSLASKKATANGKSQPGAAATAAAAAALVPLDPKKAVRVCYSTFSCPCPFDSLSNPTTIHHYQALEAARTEALTSRVVPLGNVLNRSSQLISTGMCWPEFPVATDARLTVVLPVGAQSAEIFSKWQEHAEQLMANELEVFNSSKFKREKRETERLRERYLSHGMKRRDSFVAGVSHGSIDCRAQGRKAVAGELHPVRHARGQNGGGGHQGAGVAVASAGGARLAARHGQEEGQARGRHGCW
jgi:hypothetical protein